MTHVSAFVTSVYNTCTTQRSSAQTKWHVHDICGEPPLTQVHVHARTYTHTKEVKIAQELWYLCSLFFLFYRIILVCCVITLSSSGGWAGFALPLFAEAMGLSRGYVLCLLSLFLVFCVLFFFFVRFSYCLLGPVFFFLIDLILCILCYQTGVLTA